MRLRLLHLRGDCAYMLEPIARMWMFLEPYPTVDPSQPEPEAPRGGAPDDAGPAAAAETGDRELRAAAVAGAALATVVGSPIGPGAVEVGDGGGIATGSLDPRRTSGAYLPANGRPAHVVRNAEASAPATVRLYVHPGRVLIGEMSAERVAGQLDMDRAQLFESVGAAELAADEGAGFLIELCEPFQDAEGRRCESGGCYFLGRLR